MPALVLLLVLLTPDRSGGSSPPYLAVDEAFGGRRYAEALARVDSLLVRSPDDAELLWRGARVLVCIGDVSPRSERLPLYQRAESLATVAVRRDPRCAPARTWHAASLGNIAMFEGAQRQVELCRAIKTDLDTALALNPKDDIAWSILGTYYRVLGGVGWIQRQLADIFLGGLPEGGFEDAERALARAVELAPDAVRHRYELGELYRAWDRNDAAIRSYLVIGTLPVKVQLDSILICEVEAKLGAMGVRVPTRSTCR